MKCSICKQPEADLKVGDYHYHTQCYMDEFDVPRSVVRRLLGKNPSRLRKGRLTELMNDGVTETLNARELDHYKQRRPLPDQPGCFKIFQDSEDN